MSVRTVATSAIALALSVAHFGSFDVFSRPIVTDVRFFLYYAWRVTEGDVPHLDFFENKPQLSTFAGALLLQLGKVIDIDPLIAVRVGYLAIAAACGLLSFWIFRRLGRGSSIAGFLGLLAYCSFGFLGMLPAVGNVPKLLMVFSAATMALLAHDRRWFLAGVAGALAFMDWQVGALVWLSALLSAALSESPRRPAVLAVFAGGAAGIAPFLLYYAVNGALLETFKQVIVATFMRGSTGLQSQGIGERLAIIADLVAKACPQQEWLFLSSFLGVLVLLRWLIWHRDRNRNRLVVPLAIFHGGLLCFSLLDFQLYGDFFVLLHSIAFLLGLSWIALFDAGKAVLDTRFPGSKLASGSFGVLILVVAVAVARPSLLRPDFEIPTATIDAGGTLDDQRSVAAELRRRTRGRKLVLMDSSELLFLMRHRNPLPTVYMNSATRAHFRITEGETYAQIATRQLKPLAPDVFIESPKVETVTPFVASYAQKGIASKNGTYRVTLRVRAGG